MYTKIICPFFGKNEDDCDVGCEYISSHDVKMIISYCASNCHKCIKYKELATRHPEVLPPVTELQFQTKIMNKENTMQNLSMKDTTANPAPLGLVGFGMTTILLNLHNAGYFPLDAMILGMGIFFRAGHCRHYGVEEKQYLWCYGIHLLRPVLAHPCRLSTTTQDRHG